MFRRRLTEDETIYMFKMHEILGNPPISGVTRQLTQVLPHVYIGGLHHAESMQTLNTNGISYVLNCGASPRQKGSPYAGLPVTYAQFLAVDEDNYNISQHFNEAFNFIDKAKRKGAKVLVHCAMGINRSGAICVAYLMKERGQKLLETLRMLKAKRNVVLTNPGFRYHLLQFARSRGLVEPIDELRADVRSKLGDGKLPDRRQMGIEDDRVNTRTARLARKYSLPGYRAPWRSTRNAEMAKLNKHADVGTRLDELEEEGGDESKPMLIYRTIRPMEHEIYIKNHEDLNEGTGKMPIIDPSLLQDPPASSGHLIQETQDETALFRHKPITPYYSTTGRGSRSVSVDFGRPRYRLQGLLSNKAYVH